VRPGDPEATTVEGGGGTPPTGDLINYLQGADSKIARATLPARIIAGITAATTVAGEHELARHWDGRALLRTFLAIRRIVHYAQIHWQHDGREHLLLIFDGVRGCALQPVPPWANPCYLRSPGIKDHDRRRAACAPRVVTARGQPTGAAQVNVDHSLPPRVNAQVARLGARALVAQGIEQRFPKTLLDEFPQPDYLDLP
jgi:hypothetical protein